MEQLKERVSRPGGKARKKPATKRRVASGGSSATKSNTGKVARTQKLAAERIRGKENTRRTAEHKKWRTELKHSLTAETESLKSLIELLKLPDFPENISNKAEVLEQVNIPKYKRHLNIDHVKRDKTLSNMIRKTIRKHEQVSKLLLEHEEEEKKTRKRPPRRHYRNAFQQNHPELPATAEKNRDRKQMITRLEPGLITRITEFARAAGCDRQDCVQKALEEYLDRYEP